jgi:PPOX class probable F420-dependent enzyme
MAHPMTEDQRRAFLLEGTRTGKLATVRRDGRSHVMPVWFVLDGDDVVFNTGARSVKGRAMARTGRASLCVDDEREPYAFVSLEGPVTLIDDLDELRHWATVIAARYVGADRADAFGARNGVPGELIVRLRAETVVAYAGLTD